MEKKKFLQNIAHLLLTEYRDHLSHSLLLVPNKRTRTFLFEYMREITDTPLLAPLCLSSEEYASHLAHLEPDEFLPLLFELYTAYREVAQEKPKNVIPFEDFFFLGSTILSDFDELDRHLIPLETIAKHLASLHPYEKDSPTIARTFSDFWELLGEVYTRFTRSCREKKKAYPGLIYRLATENPAPFSTEYTHVFWIGFHTLSPAEEKLFLMTASTNEIFLDMDSYFTEDPSQEAGFFYREFWKKKRLIADHVRWNDTLLAQKSDRHIQLLTTTNDTSMVKLLGTRLAEHFSDSSSHPRFDEVAIILPREDLLFAVLNSLPDTIPAVNITMGFPLRATTIANWIELLLRVRESLKTEDTLTISGKLFLELLDHQYTRLLIAEEHLTALIDLVKQHNLSRVDRDTVSSLPIVPRPDDNTKDSWTPLSRWCWEPNMSPQETLSILYTLTKNLLENARKKPRPLQMESEFMYITLSHLDKIRTLIEGPNDPEKKEPSFILSFPALARILRNVLQTTTVAFTGEPLEGVQIMGVLETQALDFDTLYILSMNEGVLPPSPSTSSLIPMDLRKAYNLPGVYEKEATYAYHFYRLLKRAREVFLFTTKATKDTESNEKSRYLEQILLEYAQDTTSETTYTYPVPAPIHPQPIVYPKTPSLKTILSQFRYSPSSLITYKTCSLKFYYTYILGVGETQEIEEDPDAAMYGTIMHKVLEDLFHPYVGQEITENIMREMKDRIDSLLDTAIANLFSRQAIRGKLAFLKTVMSQQIHHTLDWYVRERIPFSVEAIEQTFTTEIPVGEGVFHLTGKLDHLEKKDHLLWIVDYKTGTKGNSNLHFPQDPDENPEVMLSFLSDLPSKPNRTHLFQLLCYAYLLRKSPPYREDDIAMGILYIQEKASRKFQTVSITREATPLLLRSTLSDMVEKSLITIYEDILSDEPFTQTEDEKRCAFCPFQDLCNRNGL